MRGRALLLVGGAWTDALLSFDDDVRQCHVASGCARAVRRDRYTVQAWCDRYFFIPHRTTARRGGIFFDDSMTVFRHLLRFDAQLVQHFMIAYERVDAAAQRRTRAERGSRPIGEGLRGVHPYPDRGTLFDAVGGRPSPLMSMPPRVACKYDGARAGSAKHVVSRFSRQNVVSPRRVRQRAALPARYSPRRLAHLRISAMPALHQPCDRTTLLTSRAASSTRARFLLTSAVPPFWAIAWTARRSPGPELRKTHAGSSSR